MSSQTMSSPLPLLTEPSKHPESITKPSDAQGKAEPYRQTVYDMSSGSCIVECRRRRTTVPASTPPQPSFQDFVLYDQRPVQPVLHRVSMSVSRESAIVAPSSKSNRVHVTGAKLSSHRKPDTAINTKKSAKPAAVILTQQRPGLNLPPTPRPGRLPTPDIPDIDGERAFCACSMNKPTSEHCMLCKKQVAG